MVRTMRGRPLLCPVGRTVVFKVSVLTAKVRPCRRSLACAAVLPARDLQGCHFLGRPFGKMLTEATWMSRGREGGVGLPSLFLCSADR